MLSHACAWATAEKHWTINVLLTFKVHADDLWICLHFISQVLGGACESVFWASSHADTAGPLITLSRKGLEVAWYSWPFIFWLKSLFQPSSLTILHHICSPVTASFLHTTVIVLARFKGICLNVYILDFTSFDKNCLGLTFCDITINVQGSVLYMHVHPYYPHNRKPETFSLPATNSECSQNEPSRCLAVGPGVWRNSHPVLLIGNERKTDCSQGWSNLGEGYVDWAQ